MKLPKRTRGAVRYYISNYMKRRKNPRLTLQAWNDVFEYSTHV